MKRDAANIAGKNIYLDLYGGTVYYNFFGKSGYIISKQIEQKFKTFYYRYSVIFIVMISLGDHFSSLLNTFLVDTGAIGIVELYFRFMFLKQLKVIKNLKRERKISILENIIKSNEKERVVMKACAYALLSVLIVIDAVQQNFSILFLVLGILGAIYSLYIGIISVITFSKIKKV